MRRIMILLVMAVVIAAFTLYPHCWKYFGYGYGDLIAETFFVVLCAAAFLVLPFAAYILVARMMKKRIHYYPVVFLLLGVFISTGIQQVKISHKLAPLKTSFWETTATEDYSGRYEYHKGEIRPEVLDIISRRNDVLLRNGYVGIGSWRTGESGTTTSMLYLYCPSVAKSRLEAQESERKSSESMRRLKQILGDTPMRKT